MAPTHRLAIDLGTCHTVAVVRRGDEAPRALLFDGSPVMASGIYADEHGRLSVGRDAERLSQLAPERFEPYPKRSVDEGSVLLGQVEVTVVEMLASLLRRAAEESLQAGVNPVGSTVLTCPADWGGQRRNVLLEAARAANLGPVVLVDEPIAAATYCLRVLGQQVAPLQSLAVFDFGGGTLDVSVVRREFDGLRVLGVGGLDDLGGVDIDAALVGHLGQLINLRHPELWQRLSNPDSPAAHRDRRALWNEVRAAKEMLSRAASAPVHVPGTEEALHLTREELERVAGPLIDRAVDETRRVLERAGVDVRQLAGVFLVGGSSRIPLVASRLHARFGVAPVVPEQPELPVAYGGMLAVAATGKQYDNPPPVSGPVSGTPISPGYQPGTPFPVSSMPGAPGTGAFGASSSQTFAAQAPAQASPMSGPPAAAPGSPAAAPSSPGVGQFGGPPAGFAGAPRPGVNVPPTFGAPPAPVPPTFGGPKLAPPPVPVIVRPRRRAWPWVTLVIVLSLVGGCLWGGSKVFGWIGDQFDSVTFPGTDPTDENGDLKDPKVEGLKAGEPLSFPDAGTISAVAGNGAVYAAVTTRENTRLIAYATAGGQQWEKAVPMTPTDVHLRIVGDLLIVDGEGDASRGDQDARSVLDLKNGGNILWTEAWDNRLDLFYQGTESVSEFRGSKPALHRVDLRTGKSKWSRPGINDMAINGMRTVRPALTWPGKTSVGPVPSYELDFNGLMPFQESVAADPTVAVQLDPAGKLTKVDLTTGQPKGSASIEVEMRQPWLVYNGIVVTKTPDKSNSITGYRLSDFSKAWDYATLAGVEIEDFRPCGETMICAVGEKNLDYQVFGVEVASGKEKWSTTAGDEPRWYVLDGQLVLGSGAFTSVADPAVVDPATGKAKHTIGEGLSSKQAYAGSGGRVAMVTIRGGVTSVWRVAVANVGDGKVIGTADYGDNIVQNVSLSGTAVVVFDPDKTKKIWRFEVPAPK
ncbi:Hsp70 family protein [Dactylosporangium sp. NPDC005572]|uniref:Hsp70 family protein n=1 Tax=Dactylosporangium sp. NPDC005572 TaxID=3156889 RepID=UPI0033B400DD